ncbi:UNKNOWN [Stylonychia lemnae]|uniref:Uncharacterized protein n=1 Tax=Stylonychia lemnae TaxID=5949 RepID=A0A078AW42_STYLE|nr:UNKNOWN [Stylonychia lemnae]|eukprot:CDW85442.1 UNKNOWN [Stylonychia lemnae]
MQKSIQQNQTQSRNQPLRDQEQQQFKTQQNKISTTLPLINKNSVIQNQQQQTQNDNSKKESALPDDEKRVAIINEYQKNEPENKLAKKDLKVNTNIQVENFDGSLSPDKIKQKRNLSPVPLNSKTLRKTISAIPEEDEEKSVANHSRQKTKKVLVSLKTQHFTSKPKDPFQRQGSLLSHQAKDQDKQAKSTFMKSSILQRIIDNAEQKNERYQDQLKDPVDTLEKSSVSYQQIQKEPISYKLIQSRIDQWKQLKDELEEDEEGFSSQFIQYKTNSQSVMDHITERDSASPFSVNRDFYGKNSHLKNFQPLKKNMFAGSFTKSLINGFKYSKAGLPLKDSTPANRSSKSRNNDTSINEFRKTITITPISKHYIQQKSLTPSNKMLKSHKTVIFKEE